MQHCYQILGLSPLADKAAVRKAFHEQIKLWHPDRFAHDAAARKGAEKKSQDLIFAYESIMLELTKREFKAKSKIPEWDPGSIEPHFKRRFPQTRPDRSRPGRPASSDWHTNSRSSLLDKLAKALAGIFKSN